MTFNWKQLCSAAVLCGTAALALATLQAQPELSEVLGQMEGYQVERLRSSATLDAFPPAVLAEYIVEDSSAWTLRRPNPGSEIEAQIFTMLDAPGAFGLLTYFRQSRRDRFSQRLDLSLRHVFGGRTLALSSGPYFVRLQASPAEISPREVLLPAARALSRVLDVQDVDPVTVLNLPRQDLEQGSVGFYLGTAGLSVDSLFPASLTTALQISKGVEVTTASYENDGRLALVGYPTPSLAREAEARLLTRELPEGFEMKRSGILVALAEGPGSGELLAQVSYDPDVRWVKEKEDQRPGRTFQGEMSIVYGIFTDWVVFTVLFILIAGAFGAMVGASRYFYYRSHPEKLERSGMVILELPRR
ncbi:MAG TPA: DUF6599 family protein [Acidobacteriota bacterium]|nr:DUF6599 family protein [Acidobacteriota bacterium]